jgi:hypothetical protein
LLTSLAGTTFSISNPYDSLAMMALEAGGDARRRLKASGDLVTRVFAHTTRTTQ